MDHLQDELRTIDKFKTTVDTNLESPEDEEYIRFYSIIMDCTKSHSRRPSSYDVCNWFVSFMQLSLLSIL